MTQDEKNHVMSTTLDCLDKQLRRVQSSYPYIADEISEEARLGSMTHWAYNTEKPTEKKSMIGSERTRRAANHLESDAAALRSEARREAVAARKGKMTAQVDSDFDDPRNFGRKVQSGAKGRKVEQAYGLGIVNTGPPNKRRKVEHLAAAGTAMGRSSSGYGVNGRGASPAIDGRKRPRNGAATANGRKRRVDIEYIRHAIADSLKQGWHVWIAKPSLFTHHRHIPCWRQESQRPLPSPVDPPTRALVQSQTDLNPSKLEPLT